MQLRPPAGLPVAQPWRSRPAGACRLAQLLVFKKVRSALAVIKCMVSGGGSLATHLDDFFEALGLPVVNGWGLSEVRPPPQACRPGPCCARQSGACPVRQACGGCALRGCAGAGPAEVGGLLQTSPVLTCRRNQPRQNPRGSVGYVMPGTSLRVVDPSSLEGVQPGQQGLILARGPGVMQGYFRDEGATAKAFRAGGGWLDTGDLGWQAPGAPPAALPLMLAAPHAPAAPADCCSA